MRHNQLILSLFLLFTFVIALPTPAPVEAVATQVAADKTRTGNKNGNKNGNNKKTTTRTTNNNDKRPASKATDCTAAKRLATGIKRNMDIQDQELIDLEAVKKIVTSKDAANKQNQFTQARNTLMRTVKNGMSVREDNQRMATESKDNTVMSGLKMVADAQKKELRQVQDMNLKNTKASVDTINTLETEFRAGKKKNEENRKKALKGC